MKRPSLENATEPIQSLWPRRLRDSLDISLELGDPFHPLVGIPEFHDAIGSARGHLFAVRPHRAGNRRGTVTFEEADFLSGIRVPNPRRPVRRHGENALAVGKID